MSSPTVFEEKPQNGLQGLKHWRHDLLAGIVVSLVSLPLSSGIAIASGAPPIYGIISSVIAGLLYPFVQGSYVTISGPAAGLAPALMAIMISLGGAGDANHTGAGYHLLLVVIFFVGIVQVLLAWLKLARFASIFPASVVEGMLAAIGVLIFVKALPLFLGYTHPIHVHGFFQYLKEIPHWIAGCNPRVVVVSVGALVIMFLCSSEAAKKTAFFRIVPPHIFAVVFGIVLALVLNLKAENPQLLIQVPANPFKGIHLPAFGEMLHRPDLWKAAGMGLLTLMLIDGVESLATAQAIDRIDPFKRKSNPDRVLAAMGISNIVSSLCGGLTVIPGGVKSKTCIEAGGRTLWSNFVNAIMLLLFLTLIPGLVNLMPKAALGAILVYTGWKMAHPGIARHMAKIGPEQFVFFLATLLVTLFTDLLVGVFAGTVFKYGFLVFHSYLASRKSKAPLSLKTISLDLFRSPITGEEIEGNKVKLTLGRPCVCFNSYRVMETLEHHDQEGKTIQVELSPRVTIVDHTGVEALLHAESQLTHVSLQMTGLEQMRRLSPHRESVRIQENATLSVLSYS